ncbi:hypothetical protein DM02DRAFT_717104 [Periconia macrospinosa]|uniref:Serine/threonine-protein kinase ppk6 n=1 Tax=Periconia macrospinosa TaxID=97972 RepID=A0A2V1DY24_9PLEO|nr:hypothetical protein DM02DRAFT_717104 [Periconia macrospinosa]
MSADLFAEFSSAPNSNQPQNAPDHGSHGKKPASSFSFFDDLTSTTQGPAPGTEQSLQHTSSNFQTGVQSGDGTGVTDDADDWGDFEDIQPSQEGWAKAPVIKAKKSADPSVLFDAEDDFGEDDDFGDFESGGINPPSAPVPTSSAVADLLGDATFTDPVTTPGQPAGPNASYRATASSSKKKSPTKSFGSMARMKQVPKPAPNPKAASIPPSAKEEDSWDTFDDWEASIPAKPADKAASKPKDAKLATLSPMLSPIHDDAKPGELPPTNIPPPAVLLALFPPLFAEAQNQLFKPMAAQALPLRNKLLAEPATIAYLQGYLMLASVAAHIIAGRKLRWKRDQHLSQGMRIGPASSRATSGMKLSSVDKSENMKEEQEASDVVLAWKDQVGRLRHVVSAVNQIKPGTLGAVPDIQETMGVKVLKQAEGGVPAPQACMMCGLKREERVGVADQGVEDSFGEWWIDQVNMHRGCRNFWNEHRDKLKQR